MTKLYVVQKWQGVAGSLSATRLWGNLRMQGQSKERGMPRHTAAVANCTHEEKNLVLDDFD